MSLPSDEGNQLIGQIRKLFDSEVDNLGPLAQEAFHVLCAFAARGQYDPGHILKPLQDLIARADWKSDHETLATTLGYFSECVPHLPEGWQMENFSGLIDQVIGQMQELFDSEVGNLGPLAQEAFHVLCAFAARGQYDPGHILGHLSQILQHLTQLDNLEIARALAATLGYFSECVPHLPEGWLAANFSGLINPMIGQMRGLFDSEVGNLGPLAQETFHVLCAFATRGYPAPAFDVLATALRQPLEADGAVEMLGIMLGLLEEYAPGMPQGGEAREYNYLAHIDQMNKFLAAEISPPLARNLAFAFQVLCILCVKVGDFAPIFGSLNGLLSRLSDPARLVPPDGDPFAIALGDVLVSLKRLCLPHLPEDLPKGDYRKPISWIQELFDGVTGFEQVADGQSRPRGTMSAAQARIAMEALNICTLLLVKAQLPAIAKSQDVLQKVVAFAGGQGRHYFSCRWDIWWRILHGDVRFGHSQTPEVFGALARTHLASVRPDLVKDFVGKCTALATSVPSGACDACLEITITGLRQMVMVIEMQQRRIKEGGRDTMESSRLVNYARKVAAKHPGAFVAALAYLGYDGGDAHWLAPGEVTPGGPDSRISGFRGRGPNEVNPEDLRFIDLATVSIGAKKAWTDYEKELEELSVEGRSKRVKSALDAVRAKTREFDLDEGAMDGIVVIALSQLFTPGMIDTLGLSEDAKAILSALEINKGNMRAGLSKIGDTQSHSLVAKAILGSDMSEGASAPESGGIAQAAAGLRARNMAFTEALIGRFAAVEKERDDFMAQSATFERERSALVEMINTSFEARQLMKTKNPDLYQRFRERGDVTPTPDSTPALEPFVPPPSPRLSGQPSTPPRSAAALALLASQGDSPTVQVSARKSELDKLRRDIDTFGNGIANSALRKQVKPFAKQIDKLGGLDDLNSDDARSLIGEIRSGFVTIARNPDIARQIADFGRRFDAIFPAS